MDGLVLEVSARSCELKLYVVTPFYFLLSSFASLSFNFVFSFNVTDAKFRLGGKRITATVSQELARILRAGDAVSFTFVPRSTRNESATYHVFRKRSEIDWCEIRHRSDRDLQNLNGMSREKKHTKEKEEGKGNEKRTGKKRYTMKN